MTRIEQIADVRRQIANTPKHKHKALNVLEARLRTLMTRQLVAEIKEDRKAQRAA